MTAIALSLGRVLSPSRPGGYFRMMALALFAVAVLGAIVAVATPDVSRWAGVALVLAVALGALFVLGLFWPRRIDGKKEAHRAADAAAAANVAWAVTSRDGAVLDCNIAYRFLAGAGEGEPPAPPQLAFVGVEPAAALYRLQRAAVEGRAREDNFESESGQRVTASVRPLSRGETVWWFVPRLPAAAPTKAELEAKPQSALIRFTDFFKNAPVGVAIVDASGNVIESNRAFADFVRNNHAAFGDMIAPGEKDAALAAIAHAASGANGAEPVEVHAGFGSDKSAQLYASPFAAAPDGEARAILYLVDSSRQKLLERQFAQAQKMQAVGELAGGVAHDFNNILTAIIGNCDLLLLRHLAGDPSFQDIHQIRQDAYRAEVLVKQLLAFSRRQMMQPKVLLLSEVVPELSNWVKRVVGERISIKFENGPDIWFVKADESEFGNAIVNLVVNARDAMPNGGTITIRTANVTLDKPAAIGTGRMPAGDYVSVSVSDTGTGIAKDVLDKIFEPFFTTKPMGQGTGLGLSTVYGIVKQSGGFIAVESELGRGTTFRIYLPRYLPPPGTVIETKPAAPAPARDVSGQGVILLVEDEDAVRAFGARALETKGYTVLQANCGEDALDIIKSEKRAIDLLVSDVVMPGMDGPTLARTARRIRPEMKVMFVSGYAGQAFDKSDTKLEDVHFLPKPFNLKQLAAKVKDVLSGASEGPPNGTAAP